MARQLVKHGHITVNSRKVDIPSYRVTEHDIVEVREKSRELTPFIVAAAEAGSKTVPAWLEAIPSQMKGLVHSLPARAAIDTQAQEQLIVERYSKRSGTAASLAGGVAPGLVCKGRTRRPGAPCQRGWRRCQIRVRRPRSNPDRKY